MIYSVVCCNGYHIVASTSDPDVAMQACLTHQDSDYAVIILQDGREVGNNVDGWVKPDYQGGPPYDAATAPGMYDRW